MNLLLGLSFVILSKWVDSCNANSTDETLMVDLTLVRGAAKKGAVCLDGSLPGYHLHRGHGSGAHSWVIHFEGGGWCSTTEECAQRKNTRLGSSNNMSKTMQFSGILSNTPEENPDFFNWNRVRLRYCDGASYSGNSRNKTLGLYYRGQRIWLAAIKHIMSKRKRHAKQVLLSGSSAGGLATILRCDEFRELFPNTTMVKCLGDAGLFLDLHDLSGNRTMRKMFEGVVSTQGVRRNLSHSCPANMDSTSCFFPQNLMAHIKTPLFLVNAAYDTWQFTHSLTTNDFHHDWKDCRANHTCCTESQMQVLQDFRHQMLNAVKRFAKSKRNGLFINSCFMHGQIEKGTWFASDSPRIGNKHIAEAVGDWYFDRVANNVHIDRPYPCGTNCQDII